MTEHHGKRDDGREQKLHDVSSRWRSEIDGVDRYERAGPWGWARPRTGLRSGGDGERRHLAAEPRVPTGEVVDGEAALLVLGEQVRAERVDEGLGALGALLDEVA